MDEGVVRMQAKMYGLVAEMYSVVANIESMKVTNKEREAQGFAMAWSESAFVDAQKQLEGISHVLQTKI